MFALFCILGFLIFVVLAFFLIVGENGKFHRSTWAFFHESGLHLRTLHGYIYGRWTPRYIKVLFGMTAAKPTASKGEHWLAQHYHGKVLTHEQARCIINLDQPIKRRNLDRVVPYPIAREDR